MDSLARKNNCLFWNWYDLSGGIGQVKIWNSLGYAQPDFVHLTIKGYRVKGQLLFESIQRTLGAIKNNPGLANFQVTPKSYENVTFNASTQKVKKMGKINIVPKAGKIYKVRNGDSLEKIAKKNGISVSKLKKLNGLKSDKIKADQIFRIR
jgi:LysM repeat protein